MALLVSDLKAKGIIQDYSQCALLLPSAKNTPMNAGPYMDALENQGIPVYNPRSKDFLEQEEVAQCLGAFIRIVDANLTYINNSLGGVRKLVHNWVDEYDSIASSNAQLADYVGRSANAISNKEEDQILTPRMPTVLYRILAHEPFTKYQLSKERDLRLSKLTRLFDAFCSQYTRELKTDVATPGTLPGWWYGYFYYGLCGYLQQVGLDDDQDEDIICPNGFFPIMTIHQAKGLEFDFVFVGNLGRGVWESDTHRLEQDLRNFRINQPSVTHPIGESQWHDDIRRHFVAYSRAKYALILIASNGQLRKTTPATSSFGEQGGGWVRQNTQRL